MTHLKSVPKIRDTSLADVPAVLRNIANEIEAGTHGSAITLAVCLLADNDGERRTTSFGGGPVSDPAAVAALLLHEANETSKVALQVP